MWNSPIHQVLWHCSQEYWLRTTICLCPYHNIPNERYGWCQRAGWSTTGLSGASPVCWANCAQSGSSWASLCSHAAAALARRLHFHVVVQSSEWVRASSLTSFTTSIYHILCICRAGCYWVELICFYCGEVLHVCSHVSVQLKTQHEHYSRTVLTAVCVYCFSFLSVAPLIAAHANYTSSVCSIEDTLPTKEYTSTSLPVC